MTTENHGWLDKYIKEQAEQRNTIMQICEPDDPADLQELAEQENWA